MKTITLLLPTVLLLVAGCKTTETRSRPISWKQQQAYLAKGEDPRVFGLGIYDTPAGPQIRGGGRLHPSQADAFPMMTKKEHPLRPVVGMVGNFGMEWPVLLDVTSSRTWLEFDAAKKLRARPVGEQGKASLIRQSNDEIEASLSLVTVIRLGQVHIENPLVYVRMADGPLGSLARGIVNPQPKGIIGWNLLKKMEQIHLFYSLKQVALFTTEPYEPNPAQVIAALPLVEHAGVCAVRGMVDGKESLILIDPAGEFEVAAPGAAAISLIDLGNVKIRAPIMSESPGGIRIGAQVLRQFDITICPKAGMLYLEKLAVAKK